MNTFYKILENPSIFTNLYWPIAIVLVLLIFRKPIILIVKNIKHLTVFGNSIEMNNTSMDMKFSAKQTSENKEILSELTQLLVESSNSDLYDNPFKRSTVKWRITKAKDYINSISNQNVWKLQSMGKFGYNRYIFDGVLRAFDSLESIKDKINYTTISSFGFWNNDQENILTTVQYLDNNIQASENGTQINRIIIVCKKRLKTNPEEFMQLYNLINTRLEKYNVKKLSRFKLSYHICDDYKEKVGKILHLGGVAELNRIYYMMIKPEIKKNANPKIDVYFPLKNGNDYNYVVELLHDYKELLEMNETINHFDFNKINY